MTVDLIQILKRIADENPDLESRKKSYECIRSLQDSVGKYRPAAGKNGKTCYALVVLGFYDNENMGSICVNLTAPGPVSLFLDIENRLNELLDYNASQGPDIQEMIRNKKGGMASA